MCETPVSNRGVRTQALRIDNLGFTGPKYHWDKQVEPFARARIGDPEKTRPQAHYRESMRYLLGPVVSFGHTGAADERFRFELPGAYLSSLTWEEQMEWARCLFLGNQCTRLDIAIDFECEGRPNLLDRIWDASVNKAGKVDKRRPFSRFLRSTERLESDNDRSPGRTVYFGKGGPKMVRVYDKGGKEHGREHEWIRFETQLRRNAAMEVLRRMCMVEGRAEQQAVAYSHALGVVDFGWYRDPNKARAEQWVRADWWEEVMPVDPVRLRGEPKPSGLLRNHLQWIGTQVCPSIAGMADAGQVSTTALYREIERWAKRQAELERKGWGLSGRRMIDREAWFQDAMQKHQGDLVAAVKWILGHSAAQRPNEGGAGDAA